MITIEKNSAQTAIKPKTKHDILMAAGTRFENFFGNVYMVTTYLYRDADGSWRAVHDAHGPTTGVLRGLPHNWTTEPLDANRAFALFQLLSTKFIGESEAFAETRKSSLLVNRTGDVERRIPDESSLLLGNILPSAIPEWLRPDDEGDLYTNDVRNSDSGDGTCNQTSPGDFLSQDAIDELIAQIGSETPPAPVPAPDPYVLRQDEIDALLASLDDAPPSPPPTHVSDLLYKLDDAIAHTNPPTPPLIQSRATKTCPRCGGNDITAAGGAPGASATFCRACGQVLGP